MPSAVVFNFTVIEVVAGFRTRDLDHCVTTVGYSGFRMTSDIYIVLPEFRIVSACKPTSWRVRAFQYGDRLSTAFVTARWVPSQNSLITEVARSCHRQGTILRLNLQQNMQSANSKPRWVGSRVHTCNRARSQCWTLVYNAIAQGHSASHGATVLANSCRWAISHWLPPSRAAQSDCGYRKASQRMRSVDTALLSYREDGLYSNKLFH